MISEKLRRARDYERENLPKVPSEILPRYHVTGGVGWINDPNGFSVYQGEYHLFFQYHPYDNHWGPMHWGHVKSRDLIRWERLPAALAPDEEYDGGGCYSGSAVELEDGRHLLMYTGVRKETLPDGTVGEIQTQCLAVGDGVDYEKYPGNPVIAADLLPPGGSPRDFRDPKLWRTPAGDFRAVMGDRCPDGSGAVLLYESPDALSWRFVGTVAASRNLHGRMWECPDLFSLDGRDVLLVSPQEMKAQGLEFIEGNVSLCLIGTLDEKTGELCRDHVQTVDYGLDFYAPQTTMTTDGRRVMIAWMQYWDSVERQPEGLPFFGQFTTPRELHVRDGRLIQSPVRELEAYRGERVEYREIPLSGETELPGVSGRCLDMTVTVRPGAERFGEFRVEIAAGGEYATAVIYRPETGTVLVDRSRSGDPAGVMDRREFSVRDREGVLTLRLLLDRYSLELFVNGGEQAASFTIYTPAEADGIRFAADGPALLDVEKYSLEFDTFS